MKGEILSILSESKRDNEDKNLVNDIIGEDITIDDLANDGYEFLLYTGMFYIYKKGEKRYLLSKNNNGTLKAFISYIS